MSAKQPRAAYCTGCGITFAKMHILINHRRTFRCGGRFLPIPQRQMVNALRIEREALLRRMREPKEVRTDLPWWEKEDST